MIGFLRQLVNRSSSEQGRRRLALDGPAPLIYAIGDVHGCLAQLLALEQKIVLDAGDEPGRKAIVMLGDYVDRGPSSAGVLEHLCAAAPAGFERICLAGNHEIMMLEHAANPKRPSSWLDNGGDATLTSYGVDMARYDAASQEQRRQMVASHIPASHMAFLESLPVLLSAPGYVFAHAGLDRDRPMQEQSERTLLWMRHDPGMVWEGGDFTLVHGHTPDIEPVNQPNRICVDTGCFVTGVLTAVKLTPSNKPIFLNVDAKQ
jgi:serine/threonine protein phosphatase 1